jgi:hypothetical protein
MVKFLLDEQISPEVAERLKRRAGQITIHYLAKWETGRFLSSPDELILEEATRQNLTLVTYDRKTIPPILKNWGEAGQDHGGVIFVDSESFPPSDFGGLVQGLQKLWEETRDWEWKNRIVTLRR